MYLDCLLEIFKDIEYQKQCIEVCKKEYRTDDAGRIFYKYVISYPSEDKFTPDYIKYVYAMLKLWNMNNKKAKLSKLDIFKQTIKNNSDKIKQLFTYRNVSILTNLKVYKKCQTSEYLALNP